MQLIGVVILALSFTLAPLVAEAQQAGKIPRLCFLTFDPGTLQSNRFGAFFQGLRNLGYVDGRTIAINYLSAEGHGERFPALAAECVSLKADIIAVSTTPAAHAAKNATRSIPIVMLALGAPVESGVVTSLARPGGNVTGLSSMAPGLAVKRLELLKEVAPRISNILVLTYSADPISAPQIVELKKAARAMHVKLHIHDIRVAEDLPHAFDAAVKERVEGLLTTIESIFVVHRARLLALAAEHKLPAIYVQQLFATDGGLMTFSDDRPALYGRAAVFVDKILKGASPADLPVEQPTKFELVINLKTAKALGLTIPQSILVRADQLIQ
jgi:putative ABC transport system substrate-binding protein